MAVKRWVNRREQFFSGANPLNGGKLFFYVAGSTAKVTTYNSSLGTFPNTNPLLLDANGYLQSEVWLPTGAFYKTFLTISTDSDPPVGPNLLNEDQITGINDFPVTTITGEWVASGFTPTFISATSFSVPTDQTAILTPGRALLIVDSGGSKYGWIKTSVFGAVTTIVLDQNSSALASPLSSVAYGIVQSTNTSEPILSDSIPLRGDNGDRSKQVRVETSGLTTATTRVITMPDRNITLIDTTDINGAFRTTQTFTAGGTWTKPAGLVRAKITVIGGGGAGGGAAITSVGGGSVGSGAGGGGCSVRTVVAASLGATETVTIGAGGTGVAGAAGNTGGTSSFGTWASATGGNGGTTQADTANVNGVAGAAGGAGSSGDYNFNGGSGGMGLTISTTSVVIAGEGGDSFFGGGAAGVKTGGTNVGTAGSNYGGGGSGAANAASQGAAKAGGAGSGGIVIVEEFY